MRRYLNRRPATGAGQTVQAREFLEETTLLRVRFQEVDAMRIVWHGHYASYFEEGRRAFGRKYGIDYTEFIQQHLGAPVVELAVQYLAPARMDDQITVLSRYYKNDAPKLEFEYEIRRASDTDQTILACGRTVQVLINEKGELLLQRPPLLEACYRQWEGQWRRE